MGPVCISLSGRIRNFTPKFVTQKKLISLTNFIQYPHQVLGYWGNFTSRVISLKMESFKLVIAILAKITVCRFLVSIYFDHIRNMFFLR